MPCSDEQPIAGQLVGPATTCWEKQGNHCIFILCYLFVLLAFFRHPRQKQLQWWQFWEPLSTKKLIWDNQLDQDNHLAPNFLDLLGKRGTNSKLHRVSSEHRLQERCSCQPSQVSWRTAEFADKLEKISVCMSHAGDILCINRKDNMQLRIIKMLLAEQAQAYGLNVHLCEKGKQGRQFSVEFVFIQWLNFFNGISIISM